MCEGQAEEEGGQVCDWDAVICSQLAGTLVVAVGNSSALHNIIF